MNASREDRRRRNMQAIRGRDTSLELGVRRLLHARGLRYRVDYAPISGFRRRADIVFTRAKIAVFLDGCFWHGCPIHQQAVRNNADFWQKKIAGNAQRDRDTTLVLEEAGWLVLRYWEHQSFPDIADDIQRHLRRDK